MNTPGGRNFPNFIDAYFDYAKDGFCPDRFHLWAGISIISAAIQRKLTLRQKKVNHYANIFTMLVSHPAAGKSTAIIRAVDILEEMRDKYAINFRIIPEQITEPALISLMNSKEFFKVGETFEVPQSAGFFYASEASASALQNLHGDFIATMTAMYDSPKWFRKKIKGEEFTTEIENVCISMLAGATFNYLKELVNEKSVMGGFASRLIYVTSKERTIRDGEWDDDTEVDEKTRAALIQDLTRIHKLAGPMKVTPGFKELFKTWQPDFDRELIELESERLESIMSRKGTNLIKLSMILSAAESDSREVNESHFERAKALIDDATDDNSMIVSEALIANKDSQLGLNELLLYKVKEKGGKMSLSDLKSICLHNGNDVSKIQSTIDMMVQAKRFKLDGYGGIELLEA